MTPSISIEIWNQRDRPHLVWIEPWANDVTMLPGQRLVVTVLDPTGEDKPLLGLVETEGNTQVYIERGDFPRLKLDGESVECGHNRQVAIDAGLYR